MKKNSLERINNIINNALEKKEISGYFKDNCLYAATNYGQSSWGYIAAFFFGGMIVLFNRLTNDIINSESLYLIVTYAIAIFLLLFAVACECCSEWYVVADFNKKELQVLGFLGRIKISKGPIFYMEHIRAIVRTADIGSSRYGSFLGSKNVVITKKYRMYDLTNLATCKGIRNENAICRVLSECLQLEYIHCGQYDYVEIEENEIYQKRIVVKSYSSEIYKENKVI